MKMIEIGPTGGERPWRSPPPPARPAIFLNFYKLFAIQKCPHCQPSFLYNFLQFWNIASIDIK